MDEDEDEETLLRRLRDFCASRLDNLEWLSASTDVPMEKVAKFVNDGLAIDDTDVYALAQALAIVSPGR